MLWLGSNRCAPYFLHARTHALYTHARVHTKGSTAKYTHAYILRARAHTHTHTYKHTTRACMHSITHRVLTCAAGNEVPCAGSNMFLNGTMHVARTKMSLRTVV